MIRIPNIFSQLVTSLVDYSVRITAVVDMGDDIYRLETCDTAHLRTDIRVTIGVETVVIRDFVLNRWIEVQLATMPTAPFTINSSPFSFMNGTLRDTEYEITDFEQMGVSRYPLVWLQEPTTKRYTDELQSMDFADVNLYVFDRSRLIGENDVPGDVWYTTKHYTNVIEPLENWVSKRLIVAIDKAVSIFGERENYEVRPLVLAGVEDANGNFEHLFNSKLSGVNVRLDDLPFMKEKCRC
jgi:hypothetical protein